MSKLNKKQEEMWKRLNHVPLFPGPETFGFDVSSMYASVILPVLNITHIEYKEGDLVTIKVLKNR